MTSPENIIDSIEKYLTAIGNNQAFGSRTVYRGQTQDWPLVPKLYRTEWIPSAAKSLRNLEDELLRDFENQAKPLLTSIPETKLEWVALAQHHGLPTRLLDWTQSPLLALFFAVDDTEPDKDGVVWILSSEITPRTDFRTLDEIEAFKGDALLYFPAHINPRFAAQKGCFTFHHQPSIGDDFIPLERDTTKTAFSRRMRKLIIPKNSKKLLRQNLDSLGVDYFSVFPDLGGLCQKLEWKIHNHRGKKIASTDVVSPLDVESMFIPPTDWNPETGAETKDDP